MIIEKYSIENIEKENWRKAEGIKNRKGSNSALAQRDYSIDCELNKIGIIKGYFIWWCSTHHQPYYLCEQ